MTKSPGGWKLLYAFALPALLFACSAFGADETAGFRIVATVFVVIGGICAARLAKPGGRRYTIAVTYIVVVETLLLLS